MLDEKKSLRPNKHQPYKTKHKINFIFVLRTTILALSASLIVLVVLLLNGF